MITADIRNAGGFCYAHHRFPMPASPCCVIGGDGGHRPCCKLVSVPDLRRPICHRRSCPVFSPPHSETGMRVQTELGDFGAYFLDSIKGHGWSWFSTTPERPDAGRTGAGAECHATGGIRNRQIFKSFEEEKLRASGDIILPSATRRWKRGCKRQRSDSTKGRPCCRREYISDCEQDEPVRKPQKKWCRDERPGYFQGLRQAVFTCDRKWRESMYFLCQNPWSCCRRQPTCGELSVRQTRAQNFTAIFPHGGEITQEQFDAGSRRAHGDHRVYAGAYELNFDARTLSALNHVDGLEGLHARRGKRSRQTFQEAEISEMTALRLFSTLSWMVRKALTPHAEPNTRIFLFRG